MKPVTITLDESELRALIGALQLQARKSEIDYIIEAGKWLALDHDQSELYERATNLEGSIHHDGGGDLPLDAAGLDALRLKLVKCSY